MGTVPQLQVFELYHKHHASGVRVFTMGLSLPSGVPPKGNDVLATRIRHAHRGEDLSAGLHVQHEVITERCGHRGIDGGRQVMYFFTWMHMFLRHPRET